MQQFIDAAPGVRLWTEQRGAPDAPPLLLIMGAQASGVGWPEPLVDALAARHRVIRYDHRDTGRSTWAFDERPYRIADLAEDAIRVLDGLGIARAHIVGMSLGGMLAQMVLADHPDRVLSATLLGTLALSTAPYTRPDGSSVPAGELPGIAPEVLEMWARPVEDHGPAGGDGAADRALAGARRRSTPLRRRLLPRLGGTRHRAHGAPQDQHRARPRGRRRHAPHRPARREPRCPPSSSAPPPNRSSRRPTPSTSRSASGAPAWSRSRAWGMRCRRPSRARWPKRSWRTRGRRTVAAAPRQHDGAPAAVGAAGAPWSVCRVSSRRPWPARRRPSAPARRRRRGRCRPRWRRRRGPGSSPWRRPGSG